MTMAMELSLKAKMTTDFVFLSTSGNETYRGEKHCKVDRSAAGSHKNTGRGYPREEAGVVDKGLIVPAAALKATAAGLTGTLELSFQELTGSLTRTGLVKVTPQSGVLTEHFCHRAGGKDACKYSLACRRRLPTVEGCLQVLGTGPC